MKRNAASETAHDQDDQIIMNINPQNIDVGTQTDNTMNQIGTINCNAVFNTNPYQQRPQALLD